MKAFQIISPLHTVLKEIDAPACRAGEVLLRIRYVGFCGSDLNTYLGRNPMVRMPVIPGHEVGATIEAVGTDVPDFLRPGQHVTVNPYTNCGKCAACRNGRRSAVHGFCRLPAVSGALSGRYAGCPPCRAASGRMSGR